MKKRIIALSLMLCLVALDTYGADSSRNAHKDEGNAQSNEMMVYLNNEFKALTGINHEDENEFEEQIVFVLECGMLLSEGSIKYSKSDYDGLLERIYLAMKQDQELYLFRKTMAKAETDEEWPEREAIRAAFNRQRSNVWQHLSKYKSKDNWCGAFPKSPLNDKANILLASVILREATTTVAAISYADLFPEAERSKELYQLMKQFHEMPFAYDPDESPVHFSCCLQ